MKKRKRTEDLELKEELQALPLTTDFKTRMQTTSCTTYVPKGKKYRDRYRYVRMYVDTGVISRGERLDDIHMDRKLLGGKNELSVLHYPSLRHDPSYVCMYVRTCI